MSPTKPRPAPLQTLEAFQRELAAALSESRRTLAPFSVLLIRTGSGDRRSIKLARRLLASLRVGHAPGFPQRKPDVVALRGDDLLVLCHGSDLRQVFVPANRLVKRLDQLIPTPDGGASHVTVVCWSWCWQAADRTEFAIVRELDEELGARTEPGIGRVPRPLSTLERRLREAAAELA